MKRTQPEIIELGAKKLQEALRCAETTLNGEHYEAIKAVVESYAYIAELVGEKNITIRRLQKILFGASTEKTAAVTDAATDSEAGSLDDEDATTDSPEETGSERAPKNDSTASGKGHGRNGADAYHGAEKIEVPHESLQPGDACPDCTQGTVYEVARPGVLVRITGQAPVEAKVYQLQKLRCHLCGKVFTAQVPQGVAACSRRASCRRVRGAGSRCSSAAASTQGRTSPTCWPSAPRPWPRRFRCAMPCRGICLPNWRRSWPTAWPTAGGSSSRWQNIFPRSVGTYWRPRW